MYKYENIKLIRRQTKVTYAQKSLYMSFSELEHVAATYAPTLDSYSLVMIELQFSNNESH